jgi:hypothetical protein
MHLFVFQYMCNREWINHLDKPGIILARRFLQAIDSVFL